MMRSYIQRKIPHPHQCEKAILTMCERFYTYYCLKYLKERRCLREKLASLHIVMKTSVVHGTQIFITVLNISRFLNPILYQMKPVHVLMPQEQSQFQCYDCTDFFIVEIVFSLQGFFLILLGICNDHNSVINVV